MAAENHGNPHTWKPARCGGKAPADLDGRAPAALGEFRPPHRPRRGRDARQPALAMRSRRSGRAALLVAVLMLAVNWFGDSLDGTLARVRQHERPRYGFYVDHVLDAIGILFLIGRARRGRIHEPGPRGRVPAGVLSPHDRDRARHARARHFQDLVLEVRSDRTADPARRRHAAVAPLAVEHDRRTPPAAVRHWRDGWRHRGAADVHHRGNRNTRSCIALEPMPDTGAVASRDRGARSRNAPLQRRAADVGLTLQ